MNDKELEFIVNNLSEIARLAISTLATIENSADREFYDIYENQLHQIIDIL